MLSLSFLFSILFMICLYMHFPWICYALVLLSFWYLWRGWFSWILESSHPMFYYIFLFFIFSPSSPPEIIFASMLTVYYWSAERDIFSFLYFSLDIFYCPDFQWANLSLCAHCEAVNSSFLVTFFISLFSIVLLQGFTFLP